MKNDYSDKAHCGHRIIECESSPIWTYYDFMKRTVSELLDQSFGWNIIFGQSAFPQTPRVPHNNEYTVFAKSPHALFIKDQ